jgi:membrane-associated phospholipid phosphatase
MAWLTGLASVNVAALYLVAHYSLSTIRGQMLDTVALAGNGIGRVRFGSALNSALNAISLASLILVVIAVGVIALVRRRYSLAIMAVVMVAGSALTSKLLKDHFITRPEFGVDPDRSGAGNSLPSGHATAAAVFAVGLVLVLPPAVRGAASLIGATYAAIVGIATLSSGWHRPSDVIASYLLTGAWAAGAGLLLMLAQRPTAVIDRQDAHRLSLGILLFGGASAVIAGVIALFYTFPRMTTPIDDMPVVELNIGYVGSGLMIAGAAFVMMAVVLTTVHRVVPHSKDGTTSVEPATVSAPSLSH